MTSPNMVCTVWFDILLCIAVLMIDNEESSFINHPTYYTLSVVEMAHSSNLITGPGSLSTFNSAQGALHVHNRDSESGMLSCPFRRASLSMIQ